MHFFLEHTLINNETSPYGPDSTNPATKYNVTTQFSLTAKSKAFACQDSLMLVLPATDPNLVNVILKPVKGSRQFPKIQYYVYRGLLKKDFFDGDDITPAGATKTDFIKTFWQTVNNYNLHSPVIKLEPTPASFGYMGLPEMTDIEKLFLIISNVFVKEGVWFGNFENSCGFEIITETENQKIDLQYLKKSSHQIDISALPNTNPIEAFTIKKEKEKILNYLDSAAFWGTFFEKGVTVWDPITSKKIKIKQAGLYNAVISKYSTKNHIYLDIRGKRGRSYNFDGTDGQISFDLQGTNPTVQVNYETNGWPIIIKQIAPSATSITKLQFSFNYNIDPNIVEQDMMIKAYCLFSFDKRERFFSSDKLVRKTAAVPPVPIRAGESNLIDKIPVKSLTLPTNFSPVANYYKIEILRNQPQPIVNYYDDLWKVDRVDSVVAQNLAEGNYAYWKVSSKSRLVNLLPLDLKNTVITNITFFDNGKKSDGTTKTRRLYGAVITDAPEKNKNLVISSLTSGREKNLTKNNYQVTLYNNVNCHVYKGKIEDGAATVNALSFINGSDFELKQTYLHIGITDEEYNKLLYDNIAVPNPLPPVTHVPQDASNIYLHLEEEVEVVPSLKVFRKFKLGVKYEDNTGALQTKFPTADIFVYTIDGLYFFTQEYADYQEFYEEFAKARVFFRTLPAYNGEFGFDWLREGDILEPKYENTIVSGYERFSSPDTNTQYESNIEAFKFLRSEYQNIPTQIKEQLYFTPYLNIYSKPESDKVLTVPKPPHEVELRVLVKIEAGEIIDKLVFEYDKTIFTLDKDELPAVDVAVGDAVVKIKISCKKDFKTNKYIKVFAKKGAEKKLAGQIVVCKNSLINRKELKFVLVKVTTDIHDTGVTKTGAYGAAEKTNLINILYQTLINSVLEDGPDFDLSDNPDYQITGPVGAKVYGSFIYKNTGPGDLDLDGKIWHTKGFPQRPLFIDVHDKYIASNRKYSSYFTIFLFDESTSKGGTMGSAHWFGIHNLLMFVPAIPPRDTTTMNHESCHGLWLQHTHNDGSFEPERKYIYPHAPAPGSTDNVMSYNANGINSWYWQWKIIKSKLK